MPGRQGFAPNARRRRPAPAVLFAVNLRQRDAAWKLDVCADRRARLDPRIATLADLQAAIGQLRVPNRRLRRQAGKHGIRLKATPQVESGQPPEGGERALRQRDRVAARATRQSPTRASAGRQPGPLSASIGPERDAASA